MSLAIAAQHLANKGRNGDSVLVHMTPAEVGGLQALAKAHGTTLTINPETGLPEAFSMKSLLPMIAGAAGAAFGIPPMVTALALGGLQTAATGDLGKGLMAGLGAYGGGSLTSGLMGAGEGALSASADVMSGMAPGSQAAMLDASTAGMGGGLSQGEILAAQNVGMGAQPGALSAMDRLSAGAQSAWNDPSKTLAGMGGGKEVGKMGLMALAPSLMEYGTSQQGLPGTAGGRQGQMRDYTLTRDNLSGMPDSGSSAERRYFNDTWTPGAVRTAANGGIMRLANGGTPAMTPSEFDPYLSYAEQQQQEGMAQGAAAFAEGGGIASLGDYSDGGRMLQGPGDGVSDSIPASIGGKRPARLADGEFVIPARVVSELGNGSSEAGSRQLYAMLDRVQKARKKTTGRGKVAVDTTPHKLLPA